MWNWLRNLFESSGFLTRWDGGAAWRLEPLWGWLFIVADVAICIAFLTIPGLFALLIHKGRLHLVWPKYWVLFGAVLVVSGGAQLLEALMFLWPGFRLLGLAKLATAVVSWSAVLTLASLLPGIFSSPDAAKVNSRQRPDGKPADPPQGRRVSRPARDENHLLQQALRSARLGTFSWNLKNNVVWMDTAAMHLTGLGENAGSFPVEQLLERVHRDDREGLDSAIRVAIEAKGPLNHAFRLFVPSRGYRWVNGRGTVSGTSPSGAERLVGVCADITAEMSEQEALRVRTRAIEFATNGILITDARTPEHTIIYANPAFESLTGYTAEEVIGRNCRFLQGPETEEATKKKLREAIRLRQECQVTILNYRKDGTPFWNSLQISPVENDEGIVIHYVGIQTDVTRSVENERRLRDAQIAAETANRVKSEFLANMSHEIRTPLTAILGCADSLCRALTSAEPLATAKTIRSQGQLLTGILNDILDLSKIEAGKLEIHREDCSILSIIADVRSLMEPQMSGKNLVMTTTFDSLLPQTIHTDPLRFRQILINLTSNAIKFTESGSVQIHVSCQRKGETSQLQVAVTDTGIGIPPQKLQAIFEAFTQVDGPIVRRVGGTGLGLTICQRLTQMLDGDLTVVSKEGRGSTFTVSLPIEQQTMVSFNELDQRQRLKESHDSMDIIIPARILIAEDTRAIQYMLQRILVPVVDDVVVVNNGAEAVEAVVTAQKTAPFKLVLMDMQMPVMNGYDATAKLRELGLNLPVIALTAGAMAGDRERCLAVGCTDYLAKPVSRTQLLSTIQTYCYKSAENLS